MKQKQTDSKKLYSKPQSFKDYINIDRIFLHFFTKSRKKALVRTSIFFTKLGNGQLWLLFTLIMFIYYTPIGVAFQSAIFIQLNAQILIKHLIKRSRPYKKYIDLEILYDPPDPYSFPSGHTCAAFTMFFMAYLTFPVIAPFFFVIASCIAFSRIYLAAHYPSDIFGGIILAYFSAQLAILFSNMVTGITL